MNEIAEKYKSALLKVGILEIKFYADTSFIYLLDVEGKCLVSLEFNIIENNISTAIIKLWKKAIDEGFVLRLCDNCKYWKPSKESLSKGNGEDYIQCDKVEVHSRELVDIRNFCCNRWGEVEYYWEQLL